MNRILNKIFWLSLTSVFAFNLYADNEVEYRTSAGVKFLPVRNIKVYLTPELRFDARGLDKCLLEGEVKYSPFKQLDLGGSYTYLANLKTNDPTEYAHRITVFAGVEHEVDRFTPSFRIMWANYDEDDGGNSYLRYKLKSDYNISGVKIDPYAAVELYQDLSGGNLYKWRCSVGAKWRFTKKQSLELAYKLDDFVDKDDLKHIVCLGYGFRFCHRDKR